MNYRFQELKRLVKFAISLTVYMGQQISVGIGRMIGRLRAGSCVVLYYHEIGPYQDRFARQMDELLRLVKPIPADFRGSLQDGIRYAVVTFCDGLECFFEKALPELVRRNIPATVFVPSGFLGKPPEWDGSDELPYVRDNKVMSCDQLRQLPPNLITIGSHSVSHRDFKFLSEEEAIVELQQSREELESAIGHPINLFFFPYGSYCELGLHLARRSGYNRVFTNTPAKAFREPKEFVCGSVWVNPTDWGLEFKLKVSGAYCWLPKVILAKQKILGFFRYFGTVSTS